MSLTCPISQCHPRHNYLELGSPVFNGNYCLVSMHRITLSEANRKQISSELLAMCIQLNCLTHLHLNGTPCEGSIQRPNYKEPAMNVRRAMFHFKALKATHQIQISRPTFVSVVNSSTATERNPSIQQKPVWYRQDTMRCRHWAGELVCMCWLSLVRAQTCSSSLTLMQLLSA